MSAGFSPKATQVALQHNSVEAEWYNAGGMRQKLNSFTAIALGGNLTITSQPAIMDMRSNTLSDGTPQRVSADSAVSLVIPAGATLGAPAAITSASATMAGTISLTLNSAPSAPVQSKAIVFQGGTRIGKVASPLGGSYVGGVGTGTLNLDASATFTAQAINVINPARLLVLMLSTGELAVMNQSGGLPFDGLGLISTTAISAASTANNIIYSTLARTNVAYRLIGFIDVANNTVGTYTAPELLYATTGSEFAAAISIGVGQTYVSKGAERVLNLTYTNITGRPIKIYVTIGQSLANALSTISPQVNGVSVLQYQLQGTANGGETMPVVCEIPAGATYVIPTVGGAGGGSINNWYELT